MYRSVEKQLQTFSHCERKERIKYPLAGVLISFLTLYIFISNFISSNFFILYASDARHVELVWLVYMGCFLY
jgi:hypothetical protein